jgi:GGDEF domain-containing protein
MLNRLSLFGAIEQQIATCADTGGRFAVLMLGARGLREIALRFGYAQGEHAGELDRPGLPDR